MAAETFPVCDFVNEELAARGWTTEHFTAQLRWLPSMTRRLLDGRLRIGEYEARDLARVFGTSVDLWLNLQAAADAP